MPGRPVVPRQRDPHGLEDVASASRRGLRPPRGARPRSRVDVERLGRGQRLARVGQRGRGPRRRATSRGPSGSSAGAVEEEARQRPEVGQRLDLLLRDRHRRRAGPARPVNASRRRGELLVGQLAQVAAVDPAQLLLVEARRVLRHAVDARSARRARRRRQQRLVVVVAPAQQREVVAHRLGQVAGVAQLLHRRRAVALGELLAVGAVQQRQVGVERLRRRPAPRARAAAWACWRGGPRRGSRA